MLKPIINCFENCTCTEKPALSGHSKIDKTKVLMTNGSLMKAESIEECRLSSAHEQKSREKVGIKTWKK